LQHIVINVKYKYNWLFDLPIFHVQYSPQIKIAPAVDTVLLSLLEQDVLEARYIF